MEIEHLIATMLSEIEKKMGKTLRTPTDFQYLSLQISKECIGKDSLSASTIKRLCKYVAYHHTPSYQTLSIMSHYLGYSDWDQYVKGVEARAKGVSGFVEAETDDLAAVAMGDTFEITWRPDRRCLMRRVSQRGVVVVASTNSHLMVGDHFNVIEMREGVPLVVTHFIRNGKLMPDYVMGNDGGISFVHET